MNGAFDDDIRQWFEKHATIHTAPSGEEEEGQEQQGATPTSGGDGGDGGGDGGGEEGPTGSTVISVPEWRMDLNGFKAMLAEGAGFFEDAFGGYLGTSLYY